MEARESATARWTAYASLAAILLIQSVYFFYWVDVLPASAARAPVYAFVFALLGPLLTYVLGWRLMHDAWCGTALALGQVLFPPLVATYSLSSEHAAVAAYLLGIAVLALQALKQRQTRSVVVSAVLIGLLLWRVVADAGQAPALSVGRGSFVSDAIFPYSMLWVGALMSALALRSAVVRQELGRIGIGYASVGFAAFALMTLLGPALGLWPAAEMTTALTYVVPLGVLGVMPLIVWVRRVMPTVKSVVAWIAFPVIMYSCFWVVLGPVKTDRYPYSFRAPAADSRIEPPK